jgi:hypothetical protein
MVRKRMKDNQVLKQEEKTSATLTVDHPPMVRRLSSMFMPENKQIEIKDVTIADPTIYMDPKVQLQERFKKYDKGITREEYQAVLSDILSVEIQKIVALLNVK